MSNYIEGLFAEFRDYVSLENLVSRKQEEGLHLEFKQKENANDPNLSPADKKSFSEALSQFANSDGGVLVWGVATEHKDSIAIDKASRLVPIDQIEKFSSNLQSFMKDAVSPMVDGVLYKTLFDPTAPTKGNVIVQIPASDKTPHRAEWSKTREYLKRNQQGKYKLEHFDLEDMFGRRQKPRLELIIDAPNSTSDSEKKVREFTFRIINRGRNIGRFICIFIKFGNGVSCINKSGFQDVSSLNNGIVTFSYNNNLEVIHPNGVSNNIGKITLKLDDCLKTEVEAFISISCENMMPRTENKIFNFI